MPIRTSHRRPMRHGFTLVELAISLAIIGLIIGGILVGQDMLQASELKATARDISSYKTATSTFKMKYLGLPGDLRNATAYWGAEAACPGVASATGSAGTCNGNNNGRIDWAGWTVAGGEAMRFWEQLALAELIPGSYTGLIATTTQSTSRVPGSNVPEHHIRNGFVEVLYFPSPSPGTFNILGNSFMLWGRGSPKSINEQETFALDSKNDDGLPGTGTIMGYTNTAGGACVTTDVAATAQWNVGSANVNCAIIFWMK